MGRPLEDVVYVDQGRMAGTQECDPVAHGGGGAGPSSPNPNQGIIRFPNHPVDFLLGRRRGVARLVYLHGTGRLEGTLHVLLQVLPEHVRRDVLIEYVADGLAFERVQNNLLGPLGQSDISYWVEQSHTHGSPLASWENGSGVGKTDGFALGQASVATPAGEKGRKPSSRTPTSGGEDDQVLRFPDEGYQSVIVVGVS